jgi:hypothetical protein
MLAPAIGRLTRGAPVPFRWGQALAAFPVRDIVRQLLPVLLVAAALETLFLRLFVRTGVHLPKSEAVQEIFSVTSLLGSLAFNLAAVLAVVLVPLVLLATLRTTRSMGERALLVVLVAVLLTGLGATLATDAVVADFVFPLAAAALIAYAGLVLPAWTGANARIRLALAVVTVATLSAQYYTLGYQVERLAGATATPALATELLRVGEALVVVAGAAVFWAWGLDRWRWLRAIDFAAVAGVLAVALVAGLAPASTMSILTLWTTGLSLYLPLPLYLLALGLYLVTAVACWRSGDRPVVAAGLLLLLLAGYLPENSEQYLLLVLGVFALSGALSRRPEATTAQEG